MQQAPHPLTAGRPYLDPEIVILAALKNLEPEGDFTVSDWVEKTLAWLEENEPEALQRWEEHVAKTTLSESARGLLHARRSHLYRTAKRKRFRAAAQDFEEAGDGVVLHPFELEFVINEDNLRRRVKDMTGADHTFVAQRYDQSAKRSGLLAQFHLALAKAVGDQKTSDVLSEDDYIHLYNSIVN